MELQTKQANIKKKAQSTRVPTQESNSHAGTVLATGTLAAL